jgi:hypothetical protein
MIKLSKKNILLTFLYPFVSALCIFSRPYKLSAVQADNGQWTQKKFPNKNLNPRATRKAFSLDDTLPYSFFNFWKEQFLSLAERRRSGLLMKFHLSHEKPNYYSLLGQADPGGFTGKRRAGSTIYRI